MDVYCSPALSLSYCLSPTKKSRDQCALNTDQQSYWSDSSYLDLSAILLLWPGPIPMDFFDDQTVHQEGHWIGTFCDILSQLGDLWAQYCAIKTCYTSEVCGLVSLFPESSNFQPLPFGQFLHCQFVRQRWTALLNFTTEPGMHGEDLQDNSGGYTDISLTLNKFHWS